MPSASRQNFRLEPKLISSATRLRPARKCVEPRACCHDSGWRARSDPPPGGQPRRRLPPAIALALPGALARRCRRTVRPAAGMPTTPRTGRAVTHQTDIHCELVVAARRTHACHRADRPARTARRRAVMRPPATSSSAITGDVGHGRAQAGDDDGLGRMVGLGDGRAVFLALTSKPRARIFRIAAPACSASSAARVSSAASSLMPAPACVRSPRRGLPFDRRRVAPPAVRFGRLHGAAAVSCSGRAGPSANGRASNVWAAW